MPVDELPSEPHQDIAPEFSFPINITSISPVGRTYTLKASAAERARVATRLDLQEIKALTATLDVKTAAGGFIKVTGQVDAEVVQTCVVSLAPVPATISDVISARFITEERAAKEKAKRAKAKARGEEEEEVVEVGKEDHPEVAKAGRIDLGEVAVVHLALALDPYPRAPGAAFKPEAWGLEPEKAENTPASPFAALAKLKKTPKTPGSKGGKG